MLPDYEHYYLALPNIKNNCLKNFLLWYNAAKRVAVKVLLLRIIFMENDPYD